MAKQAGKKVGTGYKWQRLVIEADYGGEKEHCRQTPEERSLVNTGERQLDSSRTF